MSINYLHEIERLRVERNAVILAHNYQLPEIQDVADYVGDSLGLSRQAAQTDADVIVFCGVHFMAETAAVLSPGKRVLIPDLEAGCSLAASITADDLRAWKADHPGAVVVSYVNTTAEVKAESDYCCTSANAVEVVDSIPREQEVLFLPDMFLGNHVKKVGNVTCTPPCSLLRSDGPGSATRQADFMVHPECGCTTPAMYLASAGGDSMDQTHILSTGGMLRHAKESSANEFVVATETGILHTLRKQNPGKQFHAVAESMLCRFIEDDHPGQAVPLPRGRRLRSERPSRSRGARSNAHRTNAGRGIAPPTNAQSASPRREYPTPPFPPPLRHSRAGGNLAATRQRRDPSPLFPSAPVLSTVCGGELERGPPHPPINAPPAITATPRSSFRESGNPGRPLPSFPRRREPRSGATAARSSPQSTPPQ